MAEPRLLQVIGLPESAKGRSGSVGPHGRRADPFLFLPGSPGIRQGWAGVELRSSGVPQAAFGWLGVTGCQTGSPGSSGIPGGRAKVGLGLEPVFPLRKMGWAVKGSGLGRRVGHLGPFLFCAGDTTH